MRIWNLNILYLRGSKHIKGLKIRQTNVTLKKNTDFYYAYFVPLFQLGYMKWSFIRTEFIASIITSLNKNVECIYGRIWTINIRELPTNNQWNYNCTCLLYTLCNSMTLNNSTNHIEIKKGPNTYLLQIIVEKENKPVLIAFWIKWTRGKVL